MDFRDAEGIDWDDEEDEEGNLVHCLRHGVTEAVVDQVLRNDPSLVKTRLKTATFAVLGPDDEGVLWLLYFDWSHNRGDWLRPVTGRQAKEQERVEWARTRRVR
ncbi:MAG: hypothetical protein ABSF89_06360 [Acidimicrobiales bacterium]